VADEWPIRQYVEHELATAGLDPRAVIDGLPLWHNTYRAIRVLTSKDPLPITNAPAEINTRLAPTVYGLVHCERPTAAALTAGFLRAVKVGYATQLSLVPDPLKVKLVTLSREALNAGIGPHYHFLSATFTGAVRQLLSGEPSTWLV
jgi:hypothetical protein